MECRFCGSENTIKSGKVRNKQRYHCKGCEKYYVTELSNRGYPSQIKLQAIQLITEGISFRGIARLLKVSLSIVLKWFRKKVLIIKQIVNNKSIEEIKEIDVVEIDEMWHYTKKKRRKIWVWLTVSRATRRVLAIEVGSRGKKTLRHLLAKLSRFNIKQFCTGYWKIYHTLIDKDKLVQSKRYTTVVESINCNIRHYLVRFRRRTRCY